MSELEDLYNIKQEDTSACKSCNILTCKKPVHTFIDYTDSYHTEVLFLTDSLKYSFGEIKHLDEKSEDLLLGLVNKILPKKSYQILAAVKCPDVKEKDMKPTDREACRYYLEQTIRKVKPKLIIPLGNLAFIMLTKKSDTKGKHRGKQFIYTLDGIDYPVVPTHHPYSLLLSPVNIKYFQQDVKNAYNKCVLKTIEKPKYNYKIIYDVRELQDYEWLFTTDINIAIDLETEGLNFNTDRIMTVAICWGEEGIVIPIYHKEIIRTEYDISCIIHFLSSVGENENNCKIGQNFKFDLRFLSRLGVTIKRAYDTKVMAHFIDQNMKKGLKDLVRYNFPEVLDKL